MSNGLDKIISQIKEEAGAAAESLLAKAKEEAAGVESTTDETISRITKEAEEKCASIKEDILKKNSSAARMQRQREVLFAKQETIEETIGAAKDSLCGLEDAAYFELIEKLLKKHAHSESGEIRLNQKDLGRLPEGFETKIEEIAKEKNGSLTLSKEPCAIDGGFVLVYGGVEENCSFDALFAQAKEQLQDKLHGLLFAQ